MSSSILKCFIYLLFPNTWLFRSASAWWPQIHYKRQISFLCHQREKLGFCRNLSQTLYMMNQLLTLWEKIPSHKGSKASFLSLKSRSSLWANNFKGRCNLGHINWGTVTQNNKKNSTDHPCLLFTWQTISEITCSTAASHFKWDVDTLE